jgi:hypothetical protein
MPKKKTISQNRNVNWLGFKLSHGQALFIFSASLPGIFFILQLLLQFYSEPGFGWGLLESLCVIPDGPNRATSNEILSDNVPVAILITFLVFSLYSLFITRRGKKITSSKNTVTNYGLLIFVVSFVVFILTSARIFCHLALFNYDISYLLGISTNAPNQYQNNDFIGTLAIFCICVALMITSFFLKERNHKELLAIDEFSWFHIKLTPHRVIILLTSSLIFTIFFTYLYLSFIFLFGDFFTFPRFFNSLFNLIFIPIIIFCYYPIGKILKKHRLDNSIEKINNSPEFKIKWFKFRLDKLYSIILLTVSIVIVLLYFFQLIMMNMNAQVFYLNLDPRESYMLFTFPFMTIFILLVIVVNIYSIIKTIPSIKDSKIQNLSRDNIGN